MNKIKLIVLALFVASSFIACTSDEDTGDIDMRENITNKLKWSVFSYQGENDDDPIGCISEITKDATDKTKIKITNFHCSGSTIYAILNGTNLTIPKQTVNDYVFVGAGTVIDNWTDIDWVYTVDGDNAKAEFTADVVSKK